MWKGWDVLLSECIGIRKSIKPPQNPFILAVSLISFYVFNIEARKWKSHVASLNFKTVTNFVFVCLSPELCCHPPVLWLLQISGWFATKVKILFLVVVTLSSWSCDVLDLVSSVIPVFVPKLWSHRVTENSQNHRTRLPTFKKVKFAFKGQFLLSNQVSKQLENPITLSGKSSSTGWCKLRPTLLRWT